MWKFPNLWYYYTILNVSLRLFTLTAQNLQNIAILLQTFHIFWQFSTIEEPVRRKVRTSSTSLGASTRGFQVNPSHLSFGILKEGCTYSHCCVLKNIGVDTCRFKIKPPPPSTGIKVIYKPGAVSKYNYVILSYLLY